jgi:hypothetical protein
MNRSLYMAVWSTLLLLEWWPLERWPRECWLLLRLSWLALGEYLGER